MVKPVDRAELTVRLLSLARAAGLILHGAMPSAPPTVSPLALYSDLEVLLPVVLCAALAQGRDSMERVVETAVTLAERSGTNASFTHQIRRYAFLHNLGQISTSNDPSRSLTGLDPAPLIGGHLVRRAGLPLMAVNICLTHLERWDGQGQPRGLVGTNIPFEGRLVAAAMRLESLRQVSRPTGGDPASRRGHPPRPRPLRAPARAAVRVYS